MTVRDWIASEEESLDNATPPHEHNIEMDDVFYS